MSYRFQLRDTQTGETAIRELDLSPTTTCDFWWLEGNYACDCNRKLEWDRARNVNGDFEDDYPCNAGRNRYVFDWVEADGVRFIENDKANARSEC